MIRKSIGLFALSLVVLATGCKQESAADKITDADIKEIEADKALIGKLPKVQLDKEFHDFGTINEGDVSTDQKYSLCLCLSAAHSSFRGVWFRLTATILSPITVPVWWSCRPCLTR